MQLPSHKKYWVQYQATKSSRASRFQSSPLHQEVFSNGESLPDFYWLRSGTPDSSLDDPVLLAICMLLSRIASKQMLWCQCKITRTRSTRKRVSNPCAARDNWRRRSARSKQPIGNFTPHLSHLGQSSRWRLQKWACRLKQIETEGWYKHMSSLVPHLQLLRLLRLHLLPEWHEISATTCIMFYTLCLFANSYCSWPQSEAEWTLITFLRVCLFQQFRIDCCTKLPKFAKITCHILVTSCQYLALFSSICLAVSIRYLTSCKSDPQHISRRIHVLRKQLQSNICDLDCTYRAILSCSKAKCSFIAKLKVLHAQDSCRKWQSWKAALIISKSLEIGVEAEWTVRTCLHWQATGKLDLDTPLSRI